MTKACRHCFYWISIKWISCFGRSLTRALRDLDRAISPDEYLLNCILGCGAHAQRKDKLFVGVKHEDDFHDGGSRSDRIFCGFFHRDSRSGKAGTETEYIDHTSRTIRPGWRRRRRGWGYNAGAPTDHGSWDRRSVGKGKSVDLARCGII